ncbi:MAG: ADP-forming succinate--CoA ligase subunit beta [Phototrophicaceae bacterium]
MDLFEYQGKQFFRQYDIPTVAGDMAKTADEAVAVAATIGYPVAIKAQVQVGGRGKAGGIAVVHNAEDCHREAARILELVIKGHPVHTLWVEKGVDNIAKEYYVSFTLDRSKKLDLGMLSAEGGVEIEEVAKNNPDAIATIYINPIEGLSAERAREWVTAANIDAGAVDGVIEMVTKLYTAYVKGDADLAEINPLVYTQDGKVIALDAKVSLDNAAHGRHKEWEAFEKAPILDERERQAAEFGLQYVGLEGAVGILANGAGLAMSTLDIVNQVGGSAANFLDIGGGAKADVVANALTVLSGDHAVKVAFINIFGGITRGEEVAQGIVEGMSRVDLHFPVVVRLDGTNAEQGRAILDAAIQANRFDGLLIREDTMLSAAQRAVAIVKGEA